MAEAARAGMDEHGDLAIGEAERIRRGCIENAVDGLHLDEMVSRAHRPELSRASLPGPLRDRGRICAVEAPYGLGALDVLRSLRDGATAVAKHVVDVDALATFASGTGGDRARQLVHEPFATLAEVVDRERQREQADAAVDVVADTAGRDDAVGKLGCREPADGKAVPLVDIR